MQLAFFTALLGGTELDLVNKAHRADIEIAAGFTGADPVDRASAEEKHRMALSTRTRDASQLLEVRAALTEFPLVSSDFVMKPATRSASSA